MNSTSNPTARALQALELLQGRPGISAEELGQELGVTDRAARRYVATLREAGVPIEATRGRFGGYRLGRGLRLPPLIFSASEAFGLVMAVLDGHHAAADPDDVVGSALRKIIRALPEHVAAQAATLRQHAQAAPDRGAARPDPGITGQLVAAVARERRVRIAYRSEADNAWHGVVDPWAVVVRYGRWYLLCWSHRSKAVRTYRVDRVQAVEELADRFERPPGLDAVTEVERHLGLGWEYSTRVEFDAPAEKVSRWVTPPMGRIEPLSTDRCVLVGSTSNARDYACWLAEVPFPMRIVDSPELREAVAALAKRLAAGV